MNCTIGGEASERLDRREIEASARIIALYCALKGWSKPWQDLTDREREEFIGVVETMQEREGRHR
jgi:hypothetical protein